MEPGAAKHGLFRNLLVRFLFFGVVILIFRFAYVVTVTGESCNRGDFCFFALPETLNFIVAGSGPGASAIVGIDAVPRSNPRRDLYTSKDWINAVNYYSSVFQDLISDGYLSPNSKSLCVETAIGQEVFALKEIGVEDSIGISRKALKPLVISGEGHRIPFGNNTFDFIFSGSAKLEISAQPAEFASEITRTLKPEGFLVVHIKSKDTYSFNSFLDLFNSFELVKTRDIDGLDSSLPYIREIVMKKKSANLDSGVQNHDSSNQCSVSEHKLDLIRKAEPLIAEEPLKPWITLKRNIQNIKYLPSMADISFKSRYIYVDVGARSYGSSIGSWFNKQYPKQNNTFDIYAIEADKTFHDQYKSKKKITLLPYAAWIKNETLSFQVNGDSSHRGMGRIQPKAASASASGNVDRIQGFDLAEWLKRTVTEQDFVVMKMDVEGTEFDLIPRLVESGAICLIDEIFLECHYNRWQRCCPGERSAKYEKTYGQCLDLFASLRKSGVLVHQWF